MKRFTLIINEIEIAKFNHMTEIAKNLDCTRQHIYLKLSKSSDGKSFNYKNNKITIIDLLK